MLKIIDINESEYTTLEHKLYVTDEPETILRLSDAGHFVVPVINNHSIDSDFSQFKYILESTDDVEYDTYLKIWQRYVNIPWQILETPRCYVREMCIGDLQDLYQFHSEHSIAQVLREIPSNIDDLKTYIENYRKNVYEFYEFGTWNVYTRKDNRLIGRAGINMREENSIPEIGYAIAPSYRRQGYAYEVCQSILNYVHDELNIKEICAYTEVSNVPSYALLCKLGFAMTSSDSSHRFFYINL